MLSNIFYFYIYVDFVFYLDAMKFYLSMFIFFNCLRLILILLKIFIISDYLHLKLYVLNSFFAIP